MENELKIKIKSLFQDLIEEEIKQLSHAMDDGQNSANHEQKSTAGDKHDTARAMAHIQTEMYGKQLQEILAKKEVLKRLSTNIHDKIQLGSLVKLKENWFYISIPGMVNSSELGRIRGVSFQAPLTKQLLGKKLTDSILIQDELYPIQTIL